MSNFLKSIDMFGVSYNIKTLGKEKYTTPLGGLLTISTFFVISAISFIFGTDFLFKKNPNVILNDIVHDKMQEISINQTNHPFMIESLSPSSVNGGKIEYAPGMNPLKAMIRYREMKINDKGLYESVCYVPDAGVSCSETSLKTDMRFEKEELLAWTCLDYAKVVKVCKEKTKEEKYEPFIGGLPGDPRRGDVFLGITNFEYTPEGEMKNISNMKSIREISEFNVDVRYPKYYFNSELAKDALITTFETQRYNIYPNSKRAEYKYLKKVKLSDDFGWISENIISTYSVELDNTVSMYANNDLNMEGFKFFYWTYFYLNRNEKVFKRRFTRLQDLGAQISGFAKIFISCLFLIYIRYVTFKRDQSIVNELFEFSEQNNSKGSFSIPATDGIIIDSVVGDSKFEKVSERKAKSISYLNYYFSCGCQELGGLRNADFIKFARQFVDQRLDVAAILQLYEKVERLADLTLSEDSKELLNADKKRTILIN